MKTGKNICVEKIEPKNLKIIAKISAGLAG
jgi:hypothetical protein